MADAPARTELKVTTGAIRGSRKIHVGPLGVAMRAVDLEPSSGEPPVTLYDTSGPYSDPNARTGARLRARLCEPLPGEPERLRVGNPAETRRT